VSVPPERGAGVVEVFAEGKLEDLKGWAEGR